MIIQDGKMYMVRGDDESFEATITDDSGAAYEMHKVNNVDNSEGKLCGAV